MTREILPKWWFNFLIRSAARVALFKAKLRRKFERYVFEKKGE